MKEWSTCARERTALVDPAAASRILPGPRPTWLIKRRSPSTSWMWRVVRRRKRSPDESGSAIAGDLCPSTMPWTTGFGSKRGQNLGAGSTRFSKVVALADHDPGGGASGTAAGVGPAARCGCSRPPTEAARQPAEEHRATEPRWQNRGDDDVLRRRALQPARVDEHVEEVAREREQRGRQVDERVEQDERESREREPEFERALRRHAAGCDRAAARCASPSACRCHGRGSGSAPTLRRRRERVRSSSGRRPARTARPRRRRKRRRRPSAGAAT